MKKSFIIACLAFLLCLGFVAVGSPIKNAEAEIATSAKLEYFELEKPLFAQRDGNKVYIAEKERIVIYCDDVYHEIALEKKLGGVQFDVKNIAKIADNLLILSNNTLYSLDLSTFALNQLSFEAAPEINFSSVSSFSVNGDYFAINDLQNHTFVFKMTKDEFALHATYIDTYTPSQVLALTNDLSIYYHYPKKSQLCCIFPSASHSVYTKFTLDKVDHFYFDQYLYYKAQDVIYRIDDDSVNSIPEKVVDLSALGIQNSGGFSVSNGKILVCNTMQDCVWEYDITLGTLTDFEISFTKIDLPDNFTVTKQLSPTVITVSQGTLLYDVNLSNSMNKGYFVFNGYYTQPKTSDYLVVDLLFDSYYLISGDVTALVLKEDFTPQPIHKQTVGKNAFLTCDAKTYLQPVLQKEFTHFSVQKFSAVEIVESLNVLGVEYVIVKHGENIGYLPASFIVYNLESLPEFYSFETATLKAEKVTVYGDQECKTEQDVLPAKSKIIIIEKGEKVHRILYGDKTGYILSGDVKKEGDHVNKIVTVVLLLALSLFVSALFFEKKYLYTKKKTISK